MEIQQSYIPLKTKKSSERRWVLKEPPFLKKTDERYKKHKQQLKERGFCDAETWCLDTMIAEFILPRLRRFRELGNGYPFSFSAKTWEDALDKMIFAFDWSLNHEEDQYDNLTKEAREENWKRYEEGITLFAKYFRDLWW